MNRARVLAELPPEVRAALDAADTVATWAGVENPLWETVARAVIVRLGRELLQDNGELGWNCPARERFLAAHSSPALHAVGPRLPHRTLGAYTVARPLCEH